MKKYIFQVIAICILSFSFSSIHAQCDDCYAQAVENFNALLPLGEGECEQVAKEELETAKAKFDAAVASGNQRDIDHAGYALAHNIINYMSMMNSCYDECGSPGCEASVETANEMSNCLKECESPYADALCKTAAYIECQCDCSCDNWWQAECVDDPCVGVECDCLFTLSSGQSSTNFDGCCEILISLRNPNCCESTWNPVLIFSQEIEGICDINVELEENGTLLRGTICCTEELEGVTVQAISQGDCEYLSNPLPLGGCDN